MKQMRSVVASMIIVAITAPAFAQVMPDRREVIEDLVRTKYRPLLNGDDVRRREVLGMICLDLNVLDGGNWQLLVKNDRNPPGLPADPLVWKPTREHVDTLTDFGPAWIVHGVL